MEGKIKEHKSYGMIDISRYTGGNCEFFGSDLYHNGGISITISNAEVKRGLSSEWYHSTGRLIEVHLSHNQFIDAITSGMNTSGVPCTIKSVLSERIPQISHVEDKKEIFSGEMLDTQRKYEDRIDGILSLLEGNIGKRKADEIKHELNVLKNHISSNTNFVMKSFNEEMVKSVTEAKHSIANYIDHKVHSLGIEAIKSELNIAIDKE